MAAPLRCPVCDLATVAEAGPPGGQVLCRGCGWPFDPPAAEPAAPTVESPAPSADDLRPVIAEIRSAVPVRPPRRRRPPPTPTAAAAFERTAAQTIRVVVITLMLVGLGYFALIVLAGELLRR